MSLNTVLEYMYLVTFYHLRKKHLDQQETKHVLIYLKASHKWGLCSYEENLKNQSHPLNVYYIYSMYQDVHIYHSVYMHACVNDSLSLFKAHWNVLYK